MDFEDVRGTDGIKGATYHVAGMDVKVAVASGLRNAKELLDKVNAGEADYHFIEIMGCPGGCVNGGGQPQVSADVRNFTDVRMARAKVLYDNDEKKQFENPMRILRFRNYMKNFWEDREVIKRMRFYIHLM